mgnify:CR=1 FL=1
MIKILETDNQIANLILDAMAGEINKALSKGAIKIERDVRNIVRAAITAQPEWGSLLTGRLRSEFGLPDSQERLNTILKIWSNSIVVYPVPAKRVAGRLKGGLRIDMIAGNFEDVISVPEAYFVTEKGVTLNWLEWLLKFGDRAIIRDYTIGVNPKRSRTGTDVMVKHVGKRWSVPPEFAGTINDNFLTRALDSIQGQITDIVEKGIESSL